MQKSKIEWTDYVWNPLTGCIHGCEYCYARRFAQRLKGRYGYPPGNGFDPTLHEERLEEPYKLKGKSDQPKIFVCSMGDLFGKWVPIEFIQKVINVVWEVPDATFIFLTKNPARYSEFNFPKNAWIGYSTTGELWYKWDKRHWDNVRFVSLEPMQTVMNATLEGYAQKIDFEWLIIGKETGNRKGKHIITTEELFKTIRFARKADMKIFIKNSLRDMFSEMMIAPLKSCPQEYPYARSTKSQLDHCAKCGIKLNEEH